MKPVKWPDRDQELENLLLLQRAGCFDLGYFVSHEMHDVASLRIVVAKARDRCKVPVALAVHTGTIASGRC